MSQFVNHVYILHVGNGRLYLTFRKLYTSVICSVIRLMAKLWLIVTMCGDVFVTLVTAKIQHNDIPPLHHLSPRI